MQSNLKRNFIWNTIGSLTYFACQWLFTILVVRLSPGELGVLNSGLLTTALTVTNMFLSLASFGMYNFQVSDAQQKYTQSCYIRSRVFTCLLSVTLCAGYVAFGAIFAGGYSTQQVLCIFLCLAFRLVESVTDVYNAIDQKHGRLDIVGKTYALRGLLSLAVFAVLLMLTGNMALTLLAMTLANILFFILFTHPVTRRFYTPESVSARTVMLLLRECAPLALYSFLSTTTASVPKLMLERISGTEAIGIYGPVTAPVLLLQVGATYLFTPFITVFADHYAARRMPAFWRTVGKVCALILALAPLGLLVCAVMGRWGLETFVGAGFGQYANMLPPMVFSAVLTALVLFFSMVLTVMRLMRALIIANCAGILTALAISTPVIHACGLNGATYAAICALSVQLACLLLALALHTRKHCKQQDTP